MLLAYIFKLCFLNLSNFSPSPATCIDHTQSPIDGLDVEFWDSPGARGTCIFLFLRAESLCDLSQELLVFLDLLLSCLLDPAVRLYLQEMLVEDAVFRKLLVVRDLLVPHSLQIDQLDSEGVHLFDYWFDLSPDGCLCIQAVALKLSLLVGQLVDLAGRLGDQHVHLLNCVLLEGVGRVDSS